MAAKCRCRSERHFVLQSLIRSLAKKLSSVRKNHCQMGLENPTVVISCDGYDGTFITRSHRLAAGMERRGPGCARQARASDPRRALPTGETIYAPSGARSCVGADRAGQ